MEIIITLKDDTKLKFNRNPEDLRKARLNKEIILLFAGLYMFSGKIRRRPGPDEDTFIIYEDEGPIGGECRFTDVLSWCYAPKTLEQKGGCSCR